jgi:hypothetical protein
MPRISAVQNVSDFTIKIKIRTLFPLVEVDDRKYSNKDALVVLEFCK